MDYGNPPNRRDEMKKLILCVDRDDDIGTKTGLDTPLIGREENLNAAVALGLKDPEDSDTNSIFSAISTYDKLRKEGEDVEIASVCGSSSIGYTSDQALSKELDQILKEVRPDTAILVSDGAEDEYITPIISSKVDISHVKTVYVKQSESVENLYYMIVKSLQEEKAKKKILLPISLALLVYGFFGVIALISDLAIRGGEAISGLSTFGVGIISFVLGAYLIGRIYNIDRKTMNYYQELRKAISTAAVWLPFTLVGIIVVLSSALSGWNKIISMENAEPLIIFLTFFQSVIWWWIGAIFLHELGQVIHTYLTQGEVKRSFWAVIFSLLALTFILSGTIGSIQVMIGMEEARNVLPMVIINLALGLSIAVLGGLTNKSVRVEEEEDEEEQEEKE